MALSSHNKISMFIFVYIFLFLTMFTVPSFSAEYYIASGGNDNNNGLSPASPWQSISKVNTMSNTFVAGDQILFNRGDKFLGEIKVNKSGASGNNIIYGSYGVGELPEITGKKAVTNWTLHSGNIYKATVSDTISHLYFENKIMTIARYPNTGFLKIDAGIGTSGFTDAELNQVAGYWVGANCRVRTQNWTYESKVVGGFSAGALYFTTPTQYATSANYGYYLDNKLTLLDSPGEWFQDKSANTVYFYAPGGIDPNSLTVEGVVVNNGFKFTTAISLNYVTIQDLKISGFREIGIDIYNDHNNKIQRCFINQTRLYGVRMNGLNNVLENNVLEDNLNSAFTGVLTNGLIKNNLFNRTGLIPGYGENAWGYLGLQIYNSMGTVVENNTIDSSGYTGMNCGQNMIVKNNIVSYSCLTLNDGGGIDLDDADGLQIMNNFISYTIGNTESSNSAAKYANGIYYGPNVIKNILIQNNTISFNSYSGINVASKNTSTNNRILNNILYNNEYVQIVFTDGTIYTPVYTNIVRGNIFYSLNFQVPCMEQQMFHSAVFSDYGDIDSNYYCNPYSEFVFKKSMIFGTYSTTFYRLPTWKSKFSEDLNSNYSNFSFDQYKVLNNISGNLITNSKFQSNITPWSPTGTTNVTYTTNPVLDTGCMRIRWNGSPPPSEGRVVSNNITVSPGNFYSVSFSCAGDHSGDFNSYGRPVINTNPFVYPRRFFGYENYRRDYSFVFKVSTADAYTRITYNLFSPADSLVYIDNVNVYQVNAERVDSTQKSKLFSNNTNSTQVYSLLGITYKDLDGTPVTGDITLQPFTSRILINDNSQLFKTLNLTALIQGFYNEINDISVSDTVKLYLRNTSSPYSIIDSAKSNLNTAGSGFFSFSNAVDGSSYYVSVNHRNSIETWSSNPVIFSNSNAVYDFSSSASQAYGNNLVLKGSNYCLFGGDANQDGSVDASDMSEIENDKSISAFGYISTDLNGDYSVDASDLSIVENNSSNSIVKITP